jgi:hypothetical protein
MTSGIAKHLFILLIALSTQTYCYSQQKENLIIVWPEEYKWKIGSNQENESIHMMELIPGNEKIDKWTIIGTMMSIKGAKNVPMDKAMGLMFDQAKLNAPEAALTLIEKNETVKNPWVIFKIEAPGFKNDKKPESQLYYIVQGESSLYSNFVAVKEKKLSDEFVSKWAAVFKASELVMK